MQSFFVIHPFQLPARWKFSGPHICTPPVARHWPKPLNGVSSCADEGALASGGLRAAYSGDAVGWAVRVGSLGPWACGAWRRGIG
jgi:hypothetical protein